MNSNLNHSKTITAVRCTLSLAILVLSFQSDLTSAQKTDGKSKTENKISVSSLQTLPVVSISKGATQICSGVLVGSKSIITSKLCINTLKKKRPKGSITAQVGSETGKIYQLVTSRKLNVGILRLKAPFKRSKPTKLYSASRMAFGKNFVVAGFGKELDGEIGYLNAIYLGSKLQAATRAVACFGKNGMPALVRRPTAVIGIATYGFGDCFFDSEVTFENVGSAQVMKLNRDRP